MHQNQIKTFLSVVPILRRDVPKESMEFEQDTKSIEKIRDFFEAEIYPFDQTADGSNKTAFWMRSLLQHVFSDTLQNNPAYLPYLLPFFAALCGDRGQRPFAEINWELAPPIP